MGLKSANACYHFDILDLLEMVEMTPTTPGESWVVEEALQFLLEWTLRRDCDLNIVKTVEYSSTIAPYVKYLEWKFSRMQSPSRMFNASVLRRRHPGEEAWLYIRGHSLLIVYY